MLTINKENYDKVMGIYLGTMSYVMAYYFEECPDYMYYYKFMKKSSNDYQLFNKYS